MAFYSIDRMIEEEEQSTCPDCGAAEDEECDDHCLSWDEEE